VRRASPMYDKSGLFSVNFLQLLQSSGGFLLLMRHCGARVEFRDCNLEPNAQQ
jgi:hypothetical protein